MKIKFSLLFIFIAILAFFPSVFAASYDVKSLDGKIKVDFLEQFRVESWSTFDTGAPDRDNSYTFASSKMRLGAGFFTKWIDTYAQLHWTQFFGLPDDAMYGTGALYYGQNNGSENVGYAGVSQAWIRGRLPWVEGLSARVGRMKINGGLEANTLPTNKTLKWLRKKRVSQRMLGAFEWSRVGRSYDGFDAAYDAEFWNITTTYSHPRPGGFHLNIMDTEDNGYSTDDIDIVTVTLTMKDKLYQGVDAQAFYYYYNDHRDVRKGIAREAEVSSLGTNIIYNTPKIGPGAFDLLFWGVTQFGTWTPQKGNREDQGGYALDFEAGYKFHDIMWQPWIRGGYFYGSGDSDPTDDDHDTFFQMIPTLRIYAMTPFYNLMNTKYFFGEIMFKPWKKLLVRTDVTKLNLTNSRDAWYQGSGMTTADSFGYGAKTAHIGKGHDDLGTMWDLSFFFNNLYNYQGASLGLNLYYSHVFGGDVIEDNFKDDEDMDFFYVEAIIKF